MINKTELRKGNVVSIPECGIVAVVESIGDKITIDLAGIDLDANDALFDYSSLEPISLSPEVFNACGFRPSADNVLFEHPVPKNTGDEHKDLGTCYPSFFFNKRLGRWMDTHTRVCVDYLHELQNMYKINTKEEIQYKP